MGEVEQMGLPGERPWGEVLARFQDGTAKLRIVSLLFHQRPTDEQAAFTAGAFEAVEPLPRLHEFRQGDELLCRKDDRGLWCPVASGNA